MMCWLGARLERLVVVVALCLVAHMRRGLVKMSHFILLDHFHLNQEINSVSYGYERNLYLL